MYHGVTRDRFPSGYWLLVHEPEFEKQMIYVASKYNLISGRDLISGGTIAPLSTIITFDDGLLNVLEVAVPILRKYELPAICFAVPRLSKSGSEIASEEIFDSIMRAEKLSLDLTSCGLGRLEIPQDEKGREITGIDLNIRLKLLPEGSAGSVREQIRRQIAPPNRAETSPFRLMSREQLQQFASDPLFEIGGHTNNHVTLPSVSPEKQREEIETCLSELTEWGIVPLPLFCYPSGRFNKFTREILTDSGINYAVGTHDGLQPISGDRLAMKRISIGINTGLYEFKARLSGLYYALLGETE